jgi:hypothetical protein
MKTEKSNQVVPDIEPIKVRGFIGKPIHQYSLEGKFIKTFRSISEATKEYNIKGGALTKCLKGYSKSCKGFQWRFAN